MNIGGSAGQLLIVEDEVKLARLLEDYLTHAGFRTHRIGNGAEVISWLAEHRVDLIILDLMLPGMNGIDVCRAVRKFSQVPIIMVTARVEEMDRLLGLESGADDYICKPFSPREVVARVKTVLRRALPQQAAPHNDLLLLDRSAYRIHVNEREVQLTTVEFQLLDALYREPGRIFSRSQLIDRIYDDRRIVSERTIDSHIKKLRKKLARLLPEQDLIHSVYGAGYRYEVDRKIHQDP